MKDRNSEINPLLAAMLTFMAMWPFIVEYMPHSVKLYLNALFQ